LIFGKKAFLFSTIDKLLQILLRSLSSLQQDELSVSLIDRLVKPEKPPGHIPQILYARTASLLQESASVPQEKQLYRFSVERFNKIVYVNFAETQYKEFQKSMLSFIARKLEIYVKAPVLPRSGADR